MSKSDSSEIVEIEEEKVFQEEEGDGDDEGGTPPKSDDLPPSVIKKERPALNLFPPKKVRRTYKEWCFTTVKLIIL
jgi:hypothetical protein